MEDSELLQENDGGRHRSRNAETKNGIRNYLLETFPPDSGQSGRTFLPAEGLEEVVAHDGHPAEHGDAEEVEQTAGYPAAQRGDEKEGILGSMLKNFFLPRLRMEQIS